MDFGYSLQVSPGGRFYHRDLRFQLTLLYIRGYKSFVVNFSDFSDFVKFELWLNRVFLLQLKGKTIYLIRIFIFFGTRNAFERRT